MIKYLKLNTTLILFFLLWLIGCFNKDNDAADIQNQSIVSTQEKSRLEQVKNEEIKRKNAELKDRREVLHFAASIEREALRLITQKIGFENATLFSVLNYVYEIESGVKKTPLMGMDCNRFSFVDNTVETQILKTCFKPNILIATLKKSKSLDEFEVLFKVKEWASVIGMSVSLTNADIECRIKMKDKKLESIVCHNWAYRLFESDTSSTEVRLSTFQFQRSEKIQLILKGGFFKDLIENKKIEISVPLEGKIKLIEKELEVRDDFAEQIKKTAEQIKQKADEHINEEKNEKKEVKPEDQSENKIENENENKNEDYQKWIKEGSPQTSEESKEQSPVKVDESEIESDQNNGGVPKPATGRSNRSR